MREIDLSIVIPAFNEAERISRTLVSVEKFLSESQRTVEVVVVDDGSEDGTAEKVASFEDRIPRVQVLKLPRNMGKGFAVKAGMLKAAGRARLFMDADGSTDIREVEKLLPFLDQGFGVVVGSRRTPGAHILTKQAVLREILGAIFRAIVRILIPTGVEDTQNGFKLFSGQAALDIFSKTTIFGWAFDVEVLRLALENQYQIKEVPIEWSNVRESRMGMLHVLQMAVDILRLSRAGRLVV